ncbi:helix-turn-helix domain-containing protein [Tenacibaculum aestuarii]|uniref:helix-turn-helix domain-containing protein n=1 Tax=Tenacibaculum aestuarii TaxID=362781 RepID=UPI0038B6930E
MTRFLITLLITFSFSAKITSQTKNLDSFYLDKVNYFKDINNDSLFYYCEKLEQSENICKRLEGATGKAYGFYREENFDKAESICLKVIQQVDSLLADKFLTCLLDRKIAAFNRLFWIKKNQEKYQEAFAILVQQESIILNHPIKDNINFRNILGLTLSKAVIKNKLDMQDKAKDILLQSLSEAKNPILKNVQQDEFFLQWKANSYNCLGNTYVSLNNQRPNKAFLDSANYYYDRAYEVAKMFNPPHKDSEIIYNFRKTEVLLKQNKYQKAIDLINNYKNINNGYNYLHREYFQKAICFHNLNNSDSAVYYSNKLLKNHKKCETSKLITIYDILSKEYNNLNKLDSAFKYSALTLEQFNLARNNKDKTFNLFYNNNFNKAQLLNQEIKEKEASKQKKLTISFVTLLITFFIITFYLLKKEKEKKKELILMINNDKPVEAEKKEYNIDEELENKILNEFKNATINLDFLRPDFSINYIADKLETNNTYVSFIFNKHHDESFKQYCIKLKINYVVEKLKSNKTFRKYSIQAIADEIGYTNASAFTRAFKKHVGVTPSAFLKTLDD